MTKLKEIACPHCGQDLQLPASINAERLAALQAVAEAARPIAKRYLEIVGPFKNEQLNVLLNALAAYEATKEKRKIYICPNCGSDSENYHEADCPANPHNR